MAQYYLKLFTWLALLSVVALVEPSGAKKLKSKTCTVHASRDGRDDSPAIVSAFKNCAEGGKVVFADERYNIERVMETTGMQDVSVELKGTLLWGTDIPYWLNNSLPLGYQNMTSAWIFGGRNIIFEGFGTGTFDGNGQIWYDFGGNVSNVHGRPINLVIVNTTDSVFRNLRFVQSQFWTMAMRNSENVLMENFYINSTSSTENNTVNTDGIDTFYSNNLTFRNWTVINGDDSLAPKANSTNLLVQDSVFYEGNGFAIGSIGQYDGVFERIENVTVERIKCFGTLYSAYVKTWTGVQQNYPPNGGGGGLGYAKNLVFRDFEIHDIRGPAALISQCTSYSGATGECDTSLFQLSNITWGPNIGGNIEGDVLADLQCSGAAPCPGIGLIGFDAIKGNSSSSMDRMFLCSNLTEPVGFNCTGPAEITNY